MFSAINKAVRFPSVESLEKSSPNVTPEDSAAAVSNETELRPATVIQQCGATAGPASALPLDAQQTAAALRVKALGLTDWQPSGARRDVLAHYLACPQSRARFEYALERLEHSDLTHFLGSNRNGRTYITSEDVSPQKEAARAGASIAEGRVMLDFNRFTNVYSPDTWRMEANFRRNTEVPYYASDVTLAQYHLMSRKYGFEHVLPKQIVRANISNAVTLRFFLEQGDKLTVSRFLTETPNGKHTQRVLDALQMTATHLEWDPEKKTATVRVAPLP